MKQAAAASCTGAATLGGPCGLPCDGSSVFSPFSGSGRAGGRWTQNRAHLSLEDTQSKGTSCPATARVIVECRAGETWRSWHERILRIAEQLQQHACPSPELHALATSSVRVHACFRVTLCRDDLTIRVGSSFGCLASMSV
jgi:hypothetical protein